MSKNSVHYEVLHGKPIYVLTRSKFIKGENNQTDKCAFCGNRHIHGEGDGLRGAHCNTGSKISIKAEDGTELFQSDGYIIKTTS